MPPKPIDEPARTSGEHAGCARCTTPQSAGHDPAAWINRGTPARLAAFKLALHNLGYRAFCYILNYPLLIKLASAFLRRVRPITVLGKLVVVTRHADVREVLSRQDDFLLAELTQSKMLGGPFLLSMDWRQQHDQERALLTSVVRPATDPDRIRAFAADKCAEIVNAALPTLEIDVAGELAENVATEIVEQYLGVTFHRPRVEMTRALRCLAGAILLEPPMGSERWLETRRAIAKVTEELEAQIDRLRRKIEAAPSPPAAHDDLLIRLLKRLHAQPGNPPWFDADWIRRYMTGLMVTGTATIARSTTHAVDQLLARPKALAHARQAALHLRQAEAELQAAGGPASSAARAQNLPTKVADARKKLRQFAYEALRFRPMLPLLARVGPRATVIARGDRHQRRIPAGAHVICPPQAAMFDPEVFESPWHFRASRDLDDYVHFGYGPHICFGKYIADIQIVEIVRALLALPDLRRAPHPRGQVRFDGPAVDTLFVRFTTPPN